MPTFSRSWLMKISTVLERETTLVSLRSALRHQPRLQSDLDIAHFAFDLRSRHQRGDRVDHHHIDRVAAHQRLGDLKRLLAGIRLRDQQLRDIDAQTPGELGVQRVFDIDIGRLATETLRLGDDVLRHGRLAGRFRSVNLDDPAAR